DLAPLVAQLPVQARVLDGQRRLRGEGLEQLDHLTRKLTGRRPVDDDAADDAVLAQERHGEQGAGPEAKQDVAQMALVGAGHGDVRDLDRPASHSELASSSLALPKGSRADDLEKLLGQILGRAQLERLGRLVVLEDGAGADAAELDRARDDRREYRLDV